MILLSTSFSWNTGWFKARYILSYTRNISDLYDIPFSLLTYHVSYYFMTHIEKSLKNYYLMTPTKYILENKYICPVKNVHVCRCIRRFRSSRYCWNWYDQCFFHWSSWLSCQVGSCTQYSCCCWFDSWCCFLYVPW